MSHTKDNCHYNNKKSADYHFNRALVYQVRGDYDSAIKSLDDAVRNGFNKQAVSVEMGRIYVSQNRLEEAIREFYNALDMDPSVHMIHIEIGRAYERAKDISRALAELLIAVEKNCVSADLFNDLGRIYCELGEYEHAESNIQKAIEIDPHNQKYHAELARAYELKKDYKRSLDRFEHALALDPSSPKVYFGLGRICAKTGETRKAVDYMEKALSYNPEDISIITALSDLYCQSGCLVKAEEMLCNAIGICGGSEALCNKLSGLYELKKDYTKALELIEAGNKNKSPDMHRRKSRIYTNMGDLGSALKELKAAVGLNDREGIYHADMAQIYEMQGKDDMVIDQMREALSKGYEDYVFRMRLGEYYRAAGDIAGAAEQFDICQKISPYRGDAWFQNKILNQIEILRGATILESKPSILDVHLTNRCNINCVMCPGSMDPAWDIPSHTVEEIKAWFPYLERVSWLGGEVFLSGYFEELLMDSNNYTNFRQEIVTNGLLINESWADMLTSVNIDICYSIDSLVYEVYEKIRRGGSFQKLLNNIDLINKYRQRNKKKDINVNTGLSFTVMRSNYRELENLVSFAVEYGLGSIKIARVLGEYDENIFLSKNAAALRYIRDIIPDIEKEAEDAGVEFVSLISNESLCADSDVHERTSPERRIKCLFPWKSLMIEMSGNVMPWCYCRKIIGNVSQSTLDDLWNNKVMQEYRKKMSEMLLSDLCDNGCVSIRKADLLCV
ncbi:tetratricopeptide repeat protein [Elusimicrobiota bacterium]